MPTKISTEQAYLLPSLPPKAWSAITDKARLAEWFGPTDIEPVAGRRFAIALNAEGVPAQITGQVTGVVALERLDMIWQVGEAPIVVSWQIKPISGGCALRIVRGAVDDRSIDQALEAALQARVEQLRTYLRNARLSRVALVPPSEPEPPPVPVRPVTMPLPATPVPVPQGEDRDNDRRRFVAGGAVVGATLALLMLLWWLWWPAARAADVAAPPTPAPPVDATDAGPGPAADTPAGLMASPGRGRRAPGSGAAPGGGTGPLLSPSGAPGGAALSLGVTYVVSGRAAMSYTVTVTLANPAGAAQTWSNAGVQLTGTRMGVTVVQGPVTHHQAGQVACFNPTGAAGTIPGHGSVVFVFRVSSVVLLAGSPGTAIINATTC